MSDALCILSIVPTEEQRQKRMRARRRRETLKRGLAIGGDEGRWYVFLHGWTELWWAVRERERLRAQHVARDERTNLCGREILVDRDSLPLPAAHRIVWWCGACRRGVQLILEGSTRELRLDSWFRERLLALSTVADREATATQ